MPVQNPYESLIYYILPSFILDSFDLVNMEEVPIDNPTPELLYPSVLHLHLDEQDNRTEEQTCIFRPNGITEPPQVQDFPIHDRKTVLPRTRKAYRKAHSKKYRGQIRGRKPATLNSRYGPETFANGDTNDQHPQADLPQKELDREQARTSMHSWYGR